MMENSMKQLEQQNQKRPIFLMVLCILTFIGSGWNIISNLSSLFTIGLVENEQMVMQQFSSVSDEVQQSVYLNSWARFFESSIEWAKVTFEYRRSIAIIQLVLGLLSLLGAILMYQLRRIGFYFYVAAQILMLFVLPYFAGFTMIVLLIMGTSAFMTLLFILLYAVNLKHLH